MRILAIVIIGLVFEVSAMWDEPVHIANSGKSLSLTIGSGDPETTHILWRNFGEQSYFGTAFYTKISSDRRVSEPIKLDKKNQGTLDGQILSIPGRSTLLAVLSMYKDSYNAGCSYTKKTDGGCTNIYLSISNDDGNTWGDPIAMHDDKYSNRYSPSLLYIKELNRLIITNICEDIKGTRIESLVYQITLESITPLRSLKIAPIRGNSISKATLGYTYGDDSEILLNAIWQQVDLDGKAGIFVRAVSRNMGENWEQREYIGKYNVPVNSQLYSIQDLVFPIVFTAYQSESVVLFKNLKSIVLPNKAYSVTSCLLDDKLHILENGFSFLRYGFVRIKERSYASDHTEVYPLNYVEAKNLACFRDSGQRINLRAVADINYWPRERDTAIKVLFSQDY